MAERWTSQHAGVLKEAPAPTDGIICRHVPYFAPACALNHVLRIPYFKIPFSALPRRNHESDGDKAI